MAPRYMGSKYQTHRRAAIGNHGSMGITLQLSPFAVALFSAPLFAGLIKVSTIGQLATAPVLAVCRVEQVIPGADLPPGKAPWSTATRNMRAVLTVVRSLPAIGQNSITINYYGYSSASRGVTQYNEPNRIMAKPRTIN